MDYQQSNGLRYAPQGRPKPVVKPGEFVFAAAALDHGHIYGMCNGLQEAGGLCRAVYDPDPQKAEAFRKVYPQVRIAERLEDLLEDPEIRMIAAAAIPSKRCELGLRVMDAGKDYFTDKGPMTTLEQLDQAKKAVKRTGKKYMVYYSERIHVEGAILAGQLVESGEIGRVVQVMGMGPHRLNPETRPGWYFDKQQYGGILCDIGSHQVEQFLYYTGAKDAEVVSSQVGNYANPDHPDFEDFGCATLVGDNGASQFFRVDWLNPAGLRTWGDGRLFLLGTKGYLEIRKYIDVARQPEGDQIFLVNEQGEYHIPARGTVGFPFFGQMILDCLNRTEQAMTQEHAFKAAELCLLAQKKAVTITGEAL